MSFFNKKEDVISIELTPHGRKLLSRGKLKPTYYSFFDDDILYDSNRGGFTESNSQSKNRILSETPYSKPQTNYKGVESKNADQRSFETENHLMNPVGSNKENSEKSSGWDITFLHNTASSSTKYFSATDSQTLQIPQIESTVSFRMKLENTEDTLATDSFQLIHESFRSAVYVNIMEEQLMLNVLEANGFYEKDGLEIEVYLYEQDQQTYKRLQTYEKESAIQNDLLVRELKNSQKALFEVRETTVNPDLIEYWLRLKVDDEISVADRCSGLKNLENNNIYLDDELECPDKHGGLPDIYSTSVSDLEDCEE
jgi:hypothetical protein